MREETATPAAPHRVAVLVLDDVLPLDLGIPAQVFIAVPGDPYELILCGRTAGSVRTAAGFAVTVAAGLEAVRGADTVVVPGYAPHLREPSADVLAALAGAHARGRRLVSICTGAFALAAAGVLDGRKATTHWKYAHELAARHPRVSVDPRVLYVDEGQVLTSAGVAAGIDLCLHLVRRDLGARTANQVARSLVSAPHRDGGQAQYIERPLAPEAPGVTLASTRAWALARLHEPLTVPQLAAHAHLAPRTFARRFVTETGTTPLRWLLTARLDRARELLESTELAVDHIADRCGLGSPSNLRLHFRRALGTTPTAYRAAFAPTARPDFDRAHAPATAAGPSAT
ncbi:GlxA family transcriptional regulator [Streptomyces rochei]|uniref:GlxA family transcriptional regulator n=1 Tax=Streptomyces TaxID=1883 RepID=UPI001C22015B|nr:MULTISPECIES: helix-turn-helix domain-containing protein [Streptomyces]MBU8552439.1 helix-turn-helix domain-containing protein [Streptomyces sp. Osf17]MBU8559228.1 helix-turn-helix domain-containing protein [Streptomyces sp. Babs14]MCC8450776.1 DJ-1/PfpI family protein [Streptomyces rochei]